MFHKKLFLLLIITISLLISKVSTAKFLKKQLKDIDLITNPKLVQFNATPGISFVESGLMENLGEIDTGDEDEKTKEAQRLIRALFHRLPSGYVPSTGASKISFFLHPELIGSLLGTHSRQEEITEEEKKSLTGDISSRFLSDTKVHEKLEENRLQYCVLGDAIKKLENERSGIVGKLREQEEELRDSKRRHRQLLKRSNPFSSFAEREKASILASIDNSEESLKIKNKEIKNKKKGQRFVQPFSEKSLYACDKTKLTSDYYYKNRDKLKLFDELNYLSELLVGEQNLLVIKTMLGLLWWKVTGKVDYLSYYKEMGVKFKKSEDWPKKWLKSEWEEGELSEEITESNFKKGNSNPFFYYKLVSDKPQQTLLKQGYVNENGKNWADCGATSLRNFIRLISVEYKGGGVEYNHAWLKKLGASEKVVSFFKEFNTHDSQLKQDARDKWGLITCNTKSTYRKTFGNDKCEIDAGSENMLKVVQALLFKNDKNGVPDSWNEVENRIKTQNNSFKLERKRLDKNGLGSIEFVVDKQTYKWNFHIGHFFIKRLPGEYDELEKGKFADISDLKSLEKIFDEIDNWTDINFLNKLFRLELNKMNPFQIKNKYIISRLDETDKDAKSAFFMDFSGDEEIVKIISEINSNQTHIIQFLVKKISSNPDAINRLVRKLLSKSEMEAAKVAAALEYATVLRFNRGKLRYMDVLVRGLNKNTVLEKLTLVNENVNLQLGLYRNTVLEEPNLSIGKIDTEKITALIKALKNNKAISEIILRNVSINDSTATALARVLAQNSNLTMLNLEKNSIGDEGAIALARVLAQNSNLTTLNLEKNSIGDEGAIALAEALINSSLSVMQLNENKIGNNGAIALFKILGSVNEIELESNFIGDEAAIELARYNSKDIGKVVLLSNPIGDSGSKALIKSLKNDEYSGELALSPRTMTSSGIEDLIRFNIRNRVALKLTVFPIGVKEANVIAKIIKSNANLKEVSLMYCEMGDEAAMVLAEVLATNKKLESFDLSENAIGAVGAKAIATHLKGNISLKQLYLGKNNIGDEGVKSVAEALENNLNLSGLILGGNNITDVGAKALATALKKLKELSGLDLSDNLISYEGAKSVVNAMWHGQINLAGNSKLTDSDKENLRKLNFEIGIQYRIR